MTNFNAYIKRLIFACVFSLISITTVAAGALKGGEKSELDSIQINKREGEYKKNSIRFDLLGKSVFFGFAYDRIIYHKTFDIHLNAGLFPVQLLNSKQHSFNFAAYGVSTHKEKWNYLAGVAYSYNLRFSDELWVTHYTNQYFGLMVGFNISIKEQWDAQLLWTPAIGYSAEHTNDGSSSGGIWGIPYWVGVNTGYRF